MRYTLRDLPRLLSSPLGRDEVMRGLAYRLFPLRAVRARAYRAHWVYRTRVFAVVGSLGKSTTARAVAAAIGLDPENVSLQNSFVGVPKTIRAIRRETREHVMEVGVARPGEMRKFASIVRPDVTVVTAIGGEHRRSMHDFQTTRDEKAHMVRALPQDGVAILNGDDPNVRWMADQTRARVVTFGFAESSDFRITDLGVDWPRGARFRISAGDDEVEIASSLIGRPMIQAMTAGAAAAVASGRTLSDTVAGLETLRPTPGRLELVPLEDAAFLLRDDFKASLESVHAALDTLEELPAPRKWVVLGDISDPGRQGPAYKAVGQRLGEVADGAIICGKEFARYRVGARQAGLSDERLLHIRNDLAAAAAQTREWLGAGDVVLVKGRDTQRLDRMSRLLQGKPVECRISYCNSRIRCDRCPMVESGWGEGESIPWTGGQMRVIPARHNYSG